MTRLIDKDRVAAEINRRIAFFSDTNNNQVMSTIDCAIALAGLRDFIDTLEVKPSTSLNLDLKHRKENKL